MSNGGSGAGVKNPTRAGLYFTDIIQKIRSKGGNEGQGKNGLKTKKKHAVERMRRFIIVEERSKREVTLVRFSGGAMKQM
jgi:hypothetical protein